MISERISRNMQEIVLSVMPRACRGRDGIEPCIYYAKRRFWGLTIFETILTPCGCDKCRERGSCVDISQNPGQILARMCRCIRVYCLHGLIRVMAIMELMTK